jgi:hypothetical protein
MINQINYHLINHNDISFRYIQLGIIWQVITTTNRGRTIERGDRLTLAWWQPLAGRTQLHFFPAVRPRFSVLSSGLTTAESNYWIKDITLVVRNALHLNKINAFIRSTIFCFGQRIVCMWSGTYVLRYFVPVRITDERQKGMHCYFHTRYTEAVRVWNQ